MNISAFIEELKTYHSPLVFNPWSDFDSSCDIGQPGVDIRCSNLQRYLELRPAPKYLLVAEALGYQGGHFSGIAITSERILLGLHPDVEQKSVLGQWDYRRTSDPESPLLKGTQKAKGFNEPTDTIVWNTLNSHGIASQQVILWNIFPFHPYEAGRLLSNRTPSKEELDTGIKYTKMLLELLPPVKVLAIGRKAADTMSSYGVPCEAVPHPARGGANRFRQAMAAILQGE